MAQSSQHWSPAWHPYALLHHSSVLLWWLQTWKAASKPPPGETVMMLQSRAHWAYGSWVCTRLKRSRGAVVCVFVLGSKSFKTLTGHSACFVTPLVICVWTLLSIWIWSRNNLSISNHIIQMSNITAFRCDDLLLSPYIIVTVVLFIHLDCFAVICWVLEILAIEMSAISGI